MSGVLPAHLPLILDAGNVLVLTSDVFVSVQVRVLSLRWEVGAVLDNTYGKDSDALRQGL